MRARPLIPCRPALHLWFFSSLGAVGLYWLGAFGGISSFIMSIPTGMIPFIALIVAIKQDPASMVSIVLAVSGLIAIATFGGVLVIPVLIAFSLLFGGLTLSERFHVVAEEEDIDVSETAVVQKTGYIAAALFVFTVVNVFVPQIKFTSQSVLSVNSFFGFTKIDIGAAPTSILNFASLDPTTQGKVVSAFLFGAFLIPVAEEQFFRAFFANWFLSKTDNEIGLAMVLNGVLFAAFHAAVYGLNPYTLTIIGVSGAVFTYVDWATGTVATSTAAHIGNNTLSFLAGGNVLAIFLGQLGIPVNNLLPQTVAPTVLMVFTAYKLKGRKQCS